MESSTSGENEGESEESSSSSSFQNFSPYFKQIRKNQIMSQKSSQSSFIDQKQDISPKQVQQTQNQQYPAQKISDQLKMEKRDLQKINKKLEIFQNLANKFLMILQIDQDELNQMVSSILNELAPYITSHFKNKSSENIVAAVLVLAFRTIQNPISVKEIVKIDEKISIKLITKCISQIKTLLPEQEFLYYDAKRLIQKISHSLKLSENSIILGEKICEKIENNQFTFGFSKLTIAVGSVYLQGLIRNEPIDIKLLLRQAKITEGSLKNILKNIYQQRFEIFSEMGDNLFDMEKIPYMMI